MDENATIQKKYESIYARLESEKKEVDRLESLNIYYKNEQQQLNQKLLALNEELSNTKEKVSKISNFDKFIENEKKNSVKLPSESEENTEEKANLNQFYREHDKKNIDKGDNDTSLIYQIIQEQLNSFNDKIFNLCHVNVPVKSVKTIIDIKVIGVTYLENPNDFKTPTQKIQTFRVNHKLKMEDLVKGSLEFWELSKNYSRYNYYVIDSEFNLKQLFEKDFNIEVEQYYKSLGRIRVSKMFIVLKSENTSKFYKTKKLLSPFLN
jgi:hypothetical protein